MARCSFAKSSSNPLSSSWGVRGHSGEPALSQPELVGIRFDPETAHPHTSARLGSPEKL